MTIKAFGFVYDVSKWTKQLFSRDIFTSTLFNIKNFVLYEQNCRAIRHLSYKKIDLVFQVARFTVIFSQLHRGNFFTIERRCRASDGSYIIVKCKAVTENAGVFSRCHRRWRINIETLLPTAYVKREAGGVICSREDTACVCAAIATTNPTRNSHEEGTLLREHVKRVIHHAVSHLHVAERNSCTSESLRHS